MPIAKTKSITKNKPEFVRDHVDPPYNPIAVDSVYTPVRTLLTALEGSKWIVHYYHRIKTNDEVAEAYNVDRPLPYQQYRSIENFEMLVQSELQHSPNNENHTFQTTGTSLIYPSIIPDRHDHFIADIGDGKLGFFHVRDVTQLTIHKDTAYEIEYELLDYATPQFMEKFSKAIVEETYYVRSYADYGANPVLHKETYSVHQQLMRWIKETPFAYTTKFFNATYNTFLVPTQIELYDPFIVEFIQRIWNLDDSPDMADLVAYPRAIADTRKVRTIWDVILEGNRALLKNVYNLMGALPRRALYRYTGHYGGFRHNRIPYMYHPVSSLSTKSITIFGLGEYRLETFLDTTSPRLFNLHFTTLPGLNQLPRELLNERETVIPLIKNISDYSTYLFSEALYHFNREGCSVLERLVLDYLDHKTIDARDVLKVGEHLNNEAGDLEQFYFVPLLYILAKMAVGDLSQ